VELDLSKITSQKIEGDSDPSHPMQWSASKNPEVLLDAPCTGGMTRAWGMEMWHTMFGTRGKQMNGECIFEKSRPALKGGIGYDSAQQLTIPAPF